MNQTTRTAPLYFEIAPSISRFDLRRNIFLLVDLLLLLYENGPCTLFLQLSSTISLFYAYWPKKNVSLFWLMMMAKKRSVAKVKLYVKYVTWIIIGLFVWILLTRYLFICIWFRSGGYIDHSTKSIFFNSIASNNNKKMFKKFFLFYFRVSLSFDRWLLSQGQTDRAVSILKTFARINKKQVDESVYKKLKVIDIFSQIFIFFSAVHHLLHHPSNCVWSKWTTFSCSHFK